MFEKKKKKSDWRFWCWYTQDAKYKGRTGPINGVQNPNVISVRLLLKPKSKLLCSPPKSHAFQFRLSLSLILGLRPNTTIRLVKILH